MDSSLQFDTINLGKSIINIKGCPVISFKTIWYFSPKIFFTLTNNVDSVEMPNTVAFNLGLHRCKRWQLVMLPKLLLRTSGLSPIIMARQVLGSLAVSRHYSQRRQLKWSFPPVCRNVCLPERPPVYTL